MMDILVVDDESLIRYSLSMTLSDTRTKVHTATTGTEALAAIRDKTYNACFLDLHLPDMSGLDIMKVLRSSSPETRIIIISGEQLTADTKKMVQEHADLFLEKPFDLDLVKSLIRLLHERLDASAGAERGSGARTPADRRRHARTSVDRSILCSAFAPRTGEKGIDVEGRLRDVSSSGVRISSNQNLLPGSRLLVFDGVVVTEGTVRWSREIGRQGLYDIGVLFTTPM